MADKKLVIGAISGTSMDGIDVCLVRTGPQEHSHSLSLEVLGHVTRPYPDGLREQLLRLCSGGLTREVCLYNALLGELFAEAIQELMAERNVSSHEVFAVGSHGQTIHHLPDPVDLFGRRISSSLQIGDPSVIANRVNITTVGDFRIADMANGGQGAPLVPYLDCMLARSHFATTGRLGVFLNIGGISNAFAAVSPYKEEECVGFDIGPGNVLIDGLMKVFYHLDYDSDGVTAAEGTVNKTLLNWLTEDDTFVSRKPPKSTGREYYNEEYLERIVNKCDRDHVSSVDCIATVTEFTAYAIWYNYSQYISSRVSNDVDLIVSGGGARNETLMKCLVKYFNPIKVLKTDKIGIPVDAKEAICFAVLAYQTLQGIPTNITAVTGATRKAILGKVCLAHKTM